MATTINTNVNKYMPPCRRADLTRIECEACGNSISVHCAKYRHLCVDAVTRERPARGLGQVSITKRAQEVVDHEASMKIQKLVVNAF